MGENGAGKTTLMRVLTTVLKPTNGMVTLDGILYSEGNYEKIQRKIGYLPQEIELYPNLTVQECLEYMGDNGAGKTTLMRILTTVLKPTSGMVTLDGILYSERNYEKIQRKIGYLPQEIELYPNLTVQECLEYMGDLAGVPKEECRKRIEYYLKKTSLIEHRKKKMKQLSGGMKRRVGLVQALLNEPEFLIVDEPTTGLDPEERIRIRNLFVDFSENRTVLFSTHVVAAKSSTT